jgi:serine/threonine protein kinase/Tol biopolymer transport system component
MACAYQQRSGGGGAVLGGGVLTEDISAQLAGFREGSVLAGYRLERQVGAGGMAVVFRALDERLGRPVALKILSPGLASDPEFRTRFIAESRAAARVDDPHIIPVYEAGEAGGVLFIAMRFVAGGDLRQVLEREGALPPDRTADFVSPVASALDAAHGAGLVHRDVKPGNILVDAAPGRPDHVYLSDFGIVKGAVSVNVTAVGSYLGTPDYMAPEQISGRGVDGRTDQYSLACVAFQLLTGALPFHRDQLAAVIYAHLSVPPPSLVSRRPDLPAAVDPVVAKAMAKTTEKRYESCGDFADALREALGVTSYHRRSSASAPPSLPPQPPPYTASPDALPDLTIDSGPDSWPPGAGQTPEAAVPAQPGPPDPRAASVPGDLPPSGTSPSEIPPPTAPTATAVAGDGLPAAAASDTTEHHLAGDLETTAGSRKPAGDLGQLTDPGSGGASPQPAQRPPRRRGPVTSWILRHRLPVFALTCAALAAAVTVPLVSSGPPASPGRAASAGPVAARTGWVSLGNLSESPSPVDVYLYSSGESSPRFVKHDVAYGTILPYQAVSAGDYSVKLRAAGSPASSNPVWSVSLAVRAGGAYTVVPLRASAQQGELRVIDNNLAAPKGKSFVRVIQADLNQGQVTFHCSCAAGAPGDITTDAAPGTVSPQATIPAGTWTMTATGPSAKASLPVTLTAGTVHTEIVVAAPGGGIQIINLVDAAGAHQAPTGGSSGISSSYRYVPVALPAAWRFVSIASLAFGPSGATLAIASEKICLWDIASTRCIGSFGNASVTAVTFSPDGKTLAASDNNGHTYLWNVATGSQTAAVTDSGSSGAFSVAFSPDGKTLATGDGNGRTYLWNAATGKPILSVADPGSMGVNSVAFSPDGKILAAGDGNGRTYLWNAVTGKPIVTLGGSGNKGVMSVAFSPDGKTLAAGDDNGRTYLWNAATGKLIASLPDPGSKGVISVACSPDDITMAAGDNNGNTYIWNIVTGKLITTLADPGNAEVNSVVFSADGKTLATGDQNGSVFLWYKNLPA